jgi:hypothetical protein
MMANPLVYAAMGGSCRISIHGALRPGGDGVELGNGAEIASAVMGNHSLVVRLGQGRNLTKAGDAVGHHNIGLQDAEDILFEHPAVFVYAAIVLSPGDGNATRRLNSASSSKA